MLDIIGASALRRVPVSPAPVTDRATLLSFIQRALAERRPLSTLRGLTARFNAMIGRQARDAFMEAVTVQNAPVAVWYARPGERLRVVGVFRNVEREEGAFLHSIGTALRELYVEGVVGLGYEGGVEPAIFTQYR